MTKCRYTSSPVAFSSYARYHGQDDVRRPQLPLTAQRWRPRHLCDVAERCTLGDPPLDLLDLEVW